MKRPGVSVIEVLIAIGMAAIVIAAIGNLIGATHRLTAATGKEIQATAFARQWLETMSNPTILQQYFGCSCGSTGTCANPAICIRNADAQQCAVRDTAGFTSCWVNAPLGTTPLTFIASGSDWITSDSPTAGFTRTMTISDISGNTSTKQATVAVCWGDNDCTDPSNNRNRTQISTVLTAWKNF